MGFVYDKIASFLASDFSDLSALVSEQILRKSSREEAASEARPAVKNS